LGVLDGSERLGCHAGRFDFQGARVKEFSWTD
jgi:hypothetical protein